MVGALLQKSHLWAVGVAQEEVNRCLPFDLTEALIISTNQESNVLI